MSLAKKCDICGSYYDFEKEIDQESNSISLEVVDECGNVEMTNQTLDCCPKCMKRISDLIVYIQKKTGEGIDVTEDPNEIALAINTEIIKAYGAFVMLRDYFHYDVGDLDMDHIIGELGSWLES